jgi:hypothetical protein
MVSSECSCCYLVVELLQVVVEYQWSVVRLLEAIAVELDRLEALLLRQDPGLQEKPPQLRKIPLNPMFPAMSSSRFYSS